MWRQPWRQWSKSENALKRIYVYAAAALLGFWSFFPLYLSVVASITPELTIITHGFTIIPTAFTNRNYRWVFQIYSASEFPANSVLTEFFAPLLPLIPKAFMNSIILSVSASTIGIAIASVAAYAFGRIKFRFRTLLLFVFLSAQLLPSISILLPYITLLTAVGLNGTYPGLILTYLTLIVPLCTWVLSGYFASLPYDVERAAKIDGATRWKTITRVVFPMARPGILAVWLLALLIGWNEMLFGLLIGGNVIEPLQPLILQFSPLCSGSCYSQYSFISGLMIVSIIFPIILALFFQKYLGRLNIIDPVSMVE